MKFRSKQNCVDCHFFVQEEREFRPAITLEIEEPQRQAIRNADYSWLGEHTTLCCANGVWDEGHNFKRANRNHVIVETDRRDFCFWWKHHPAMLLPAAKILQERDAKSRATSLERRLTRYGLWIAAIALVINAYLKIAETLKLWPFK